MAAGRFHIIVDLAQVPDQKLVDVVGLEGFLNELPGKIGMHVLKPPVIAEGIPQNPGLSGFVIIDFSHISIHTFTEHKQVLVDIFSCKPYEQKDAEDAVLGYFGVGRSASKIQVVNWA